jgi:hypothetical protein
MGLEDLQHVSSLDALGKGRREAAAPAGGG